MNSVRFAMCTALVLSLSFAACDRLMPRPQDETLPGVDAIKQLYQQHGITAAYRYSGNVVEVVVQQPRDQLRRGSQLWARVGPYIYLFSPATRALFEAYPGVAGVRVITRTGREEVARALLARDRLTDYTWRRAIAVMSHAVEQGTTRPSTMDRLVQFGEEHADFEYNPAFVPPRRSGR